MQRYAKGTPVWAFYRMSRQPEDRLFLACLDRQAGILRPRVGLSEGWIPTEVRRDFDPGSFDAGDPETWVPVRRLWPHFYDRRGAVADGGGAGGEDRMVPAHVAPRPGGADRLTRAAPPELGLIAVRWGGRPTVSSKEWGRTGSPVSDTYFAAFLEHGVVGALGLDGRYEVWTVYVEDAADLETLADSAHLIFGAAHPIRRSKHVKAGFFLYHTAFDLRFIAAHESQGNEGAGYVDRQPYTRMIQAFERAGIRTEHPHSSYLYDALAGKSWQHSMCLDPTLRVPAGLAVSRGDIESDLEGAARDCLAGLAAVRRAQHRRGLVPVAVAEGRSQKTSDSGSRSPYAVHRGVAKLGYSWEAQDVKHWRGEAGLRDAFRALTRHREVRGTAAGQAHDCDHLIVQEFVPHDCELRLYFVEGVCELALATRMEPVGDGSDFGDLVCCTPGEARYRFFGGDGSALDNALGQCRTLSLAWLDWLMVENSGRIPPAIRFDFLVRKTEPGSADVRMLEICEQGFSWLGDETLPPKVFAAVARSCVGRRVPRAPHQLPPSGADRPPPPDASICYERRPAVRPTLRLALTEDGAIAYDTARDSVHQLNSTAAVLLVLCDGHHELAEIQAFVRGGLGAADAGVEAADLDSWLVDAVKEGLVVFGRGGGPVDREMSDEEMARCRALLRRQEEEEREA